VANVMHVIAHDHQIMYATAVGVETVVMQARDLESLDSNVADA
jgi:hypothetical protein